VRLGESARGHVEEVVTADTLRAMAAALMPPGHREGVARNRRAAAILLSFGIFCPVLEISKINEGMNFDEIVLEISLKG